MKQTNYTPLIEVTRGSIVESVHFGAVAVVDSSGKLMASCGDPNTVTYMRSSSKPLQVLPFVEAGGVEKFNLTERELAILCASHSGTDEHVKVIEGIQKKTGVREENMMCGTHPPTHQATREAMIRRGEKPTPNRHNCSGKHNGFLAFAVMRNLPLEDYINPNHPIQQTITQTFAEMCDMRLEDILIGVDGCSAPVFGLPLYNAALGYARLCDPAGLPEKRAVACRKITHAMAANPDMIAGPDEFDTDLMRVVGGNLITKAGAEGYQSVGLLPGSLGKNSRGVGICLKISDGDTLDRARPAAALEILRQLGMPLSTDQLKSLKKYGTHPVLNWRILEVGELHSSFDLEMFA
jgi:L-asparaginase II